MRLLHGLYNVFGRPEWGTVPDPRRLAGLSLGANLAAGPGVRPD
jgi:hypothetical protein